MFCYDYDLVWLYMDLSWSACVLMCLYALGVCLWAWCAQCAWLQRFADLRKKYAMQFWSMYVSMSWRYLAAILPSFLRHIAAMSPICCRYFAHLAAICLLFLRYSAVMLLLFAASRRYYHLVLSFTTHCRHFVKFKLPGDGNLNFPGFVHSNKNLSLLV